MEKEANQLLKQTRYQSGSPRGTNSAAVCEAEARARLYVLNVARQEVKRQERESQEAEQQWAAAAAMQQA